MLIAKHFRGATSEDVLLSGLCQPSRHLEVEMLAEMGRMCCW